MDNLRVIIPAAGKGTRLCSEQHTAPKVMREVAGRPLLQTVLEATSFIKPEDTFVVVGYKKEQVTDFFGPAYQYIEQTEQLGTGHAVMVCQDRFADFDGSVLVTFGDMPLFRKEDLEAICRFHAESGAACTLMTAENPELTLWARIIRSSEGCFQAIVEGKDCTPEQAKINELFAGVLVFDSRELFRTLPEIRTNNIQKEYYLTEVPELMLRKGLKVETYRIEDGDDLRGVNTPEDLAICERILSARLRQRAENAFQAGFARVDITPEPGLGLAGYYMLRLADRVLDPLEVNALALRKGQSRMVLLSLDATEIVDEAAPALRAAVSSALALPAEAVWLSATHTHSAPYIGKALQGAPQELTDRYTAFLTERLIEAGRKALDNLKPARLSYARGLCPDIAFVRRYRMKDGSVCTNPGVGNPDVVCALGEPDEHVHILRLDRENAESLVIASFGCHPDTIGGLNISADWPGFFRRSFEAAVENTRCLFVNGALGDVNHIKTFAKEGDGYMNDMTVDFDNVPRGYGQARHMGRAVAGSVMAVYDKTVSVEVSRLAFDVRTVELPTHMPTPEELPGAHYIVDMHKAGRDDELPYEGMNLTTAVAEAERICEYENGPAALPMTLSALSLGSIALVGIAGEPFGLIGKALAALPGYRAVLTCALTNGYSGYFPPKSAYEEGGYEALSSPFKSGVGELIIENAEKMLKDLQ